MSYQGSLLVFRGQETIGEYPFRMGDVPSNEYIEDVLSNLKPDLSGVFLGPFGVMAHSDTLPTDNPWYRKTVLKVPHKIVEKNVDSKLNP